MQESETGRLWDQLQRRIGYRFEQPLLLRQALTHRSSSSINNERLEFLGDALISAFVAERLYTLQPRAGEGALSRLRASLVREQSLARLARDIDLGPLLQLGEGELKSGGWRRDSVLADALEALVDPRQQPHDPAWLKARRGAGIDTEGPGRRFAPETRILKVKEPGCALDVREAFRILSSQALELRPPHQLA